MKKLFLILAFALVPSVAFAQCTGVFPANTLCGNLGGSPAPPSAFSSSGLVTNPSGQVFTATPNYGASNTQNILQGVLGTVGTPNAVADAPFIFQKWATGVAPPVKDPALYVAAWKTSNAPNLNVQGIFSEVVDNAGWNGTSAVNFIEGVRSQATVLGSLGSGYGIVCAAGDGASVTYTFLVGCEGVTVNNSGVDASTVAFFNKNHFSASFVSSEFGTNKSDAGFLVNPFSTHTYRTGFLVGETSVDDTAFASRAATVVGLDLAVGAQSFAAIRIPNSTPIMALNQAGSGNVNIAYVDTINNVVLGTTAVATRPAGGAPTLTPACTGIGTTGTCTLNTGSNNNVGKITIAPNGTGITAIATLTITFSAAIGPNGSVCNFTPQQGTANWVAPITLIGAGATSTAFAVNAVNASTNFTSGSTYLLGYVCFGY